MPTELGLEGSGGGRGRLRRQEDAAAGSEQCILMVVGEPHPHQAVQMARQPPPRYHLSVCRSNCTSSAHFHEY